MLYSILHSSNNFREIKISPFKENIWRSCFKEIFPESITHTLIHHKLILYTS